MFFEIFYVYLQYIMIFKNMDLPILYKLNVNNKINTWKIIIEENYYWTEFGMLDGTIQKSDKVFCFGKNKGKKNETSDEQQAFLEAKSIWLRKIEKENFFTNIEDVHDITFNPPMLAKVYKGEYEDDMKFIQPKLDGVRCNISLDKGEIISKSRKNKKFYSTAHIEAELSEIFEKYPDLHLDGELYNHDLHDDFNKIVSLVKKQKITENDKRNIESTVHYYVYDAWFDNLPGATFDERFKMVREALLHLKNVVIVPTYKVGSGKDIDYYFNMFTSNGYEGAIIRLDKPYEHKRSSNLLKYKKFQDDEFEIIEVNIGKTNTIAESLTIRLKNGNLCNATLAFPDDKCKEILENKDKYIGKMATVCYFGITNDGMLRFPVVKSFNREEYE